MDYLGALRAFVRSVELGSFSKASTEMGIKVSTVSRHVAALEADLGAALLNRSTRRIRLTEAGTVFYQRVAHIFADIEEARQAATAMNSRPQGVLKVHMPGAFGRLHVMPHLADFLAEYPDIRIDGTLTDATVDLVEVGADVAVRIGALDEATLMGRRLAPHRRVACASPGYLDRVGPIAAPSDLSRMDCLESALQPSRSWYFSGKPTTGPIAVATSGRLRLNDSEALLAAAVGGLGVALLPTWLAAADVRAGRLVLALSDWQAEIFDGPARSIWAIYPRKRTVSPKVKAFLRFLELRFGQPPYWDREIGRGAKAASDD